MINIDESTYLIELTRGDNATITFSAVDADDNVYVPVEGDTLVFAVGKRRNADPIFQIENPFGTFSAASPTQAEFEADPTIYFYVSGDDFVRCAESATYSASTQYYTSTFWDISILPEHTASMKSGMFVWDLQLETSDGTIDTIIGATDSLDPKFKIWGEVSQ